MARIMLILIFFCGIIRLVSSEDVKSENILNGGSFDQFSDIKDLRASGWRMNVPQEPSKYHPEGIEIILEDNSGNKSLRLSAKAQAIVFAVSPALKVSGNVALQLSARIKTENVLRGKEEWFGARMQVTPYDRNGNPIKGGRTVATLEGTREWGSYTRTFVTPPETSFVEISFNLKNSSGTMWVDDVKIVKANKISSIDEAFLNLEIDKSIPNVIPAPMSAVYGKDFTDISNVILTLGNCCDVTLRAFLDEFFEKHSIKVDALSQSTLTELHIGSFSEPFISEALEYLKVADKARTLGTQGYVIFSGKLDGRPAVILASDGNPGRFYALQTLKQLILKDGKLRNCLIFDKPGFEKRGIICGNQKFWFDGPPVRDLKTGKKIYPKDAWTYRQRAIDLKMNYIWTCAPSARDCMVTPIPKAKLDEFRKFVEDCHRIYVDVTAGISPWRQNPHPGREKGGVIYSSEEDISGAVENLKRLYNCGVRDLYLAFDDFPTYRWLEYEQDKKAFKTIGKAHVFYITEVYKRLKENCQDATLRIIPISYCAGNNLPDSWIEYSRDIAALPDDIELVKDGIDASMIADYSKLCGGKKIFTWSNYFTSLYEKLNRIPLFSYPYNPDRNLEKITTGHITLMNYWPNEDTAYISWYTAADYIWNPLEYNMKGAFQRAVAKSVGDGLPWVKKYMCIVHSFQKNLGLPGRTGQEKLKAAEELKSSLDECLENLKKHTRESLIRDLEQETSGITEDLDVLIEQYKKKPLPSSVRKTSVPPVIDGLADNDKCWTEADKLSGFIGLRDKNWVDVQTTVQLCYDKDNLYIFAKMDEPFMAKIAARFDKRDQEIFLDDCFEAFIGSTKDVKDYYHIGINSRGAIYDERRILNDCTRWDGVSCAAASKQKDSWCVEMAVPWSKIENIAGDSVLTCNFARERHAGAGTAQISTYAPLIGRAFHVPQWFWLLKLEDNESTN